MKISKIIIVCAAFFALLSCDRSRQTSLEDAAPASGVEAEAVADTTVPRTGAEVTKTLIAGDIEIGFPHLVRSSSQEVVDGVARHTVRIEYTADDEDAIAAVLEDAFSSAGYKVKADGLKFVAFGETTKVRYLISPADRDLQVRLSSAESKGLVTFIW